MLISQSCVLNPEQAIKDLNFTEILITRIKHFEGKISYTESYKCFKQFATTSGRTTQGASGLKPRFCKAIDS